MSNENAIDENIKTGVLRIDGTNKAIPMDEWDKIWKSHPSYCPLGGEHPEYANRCESLDREFEDLYEQLDEMHRESLGGSRLADGTPMNYITLQEAAILDLRECLTRQQAGKP